MIQIQEAYVTLVSKDCVEVELRYPEGDHGVRYRLAKAKVPRLRVLARNWVFFGVLWLPLIPIPLISLTVLHSPYLLSISYPPLYYFRPLFISHPHRPPVPVVANKAKARSKARRVSE